jgi:beta-galactosidase
MFDFGADARAEGGENGQNHKGLVTFDRKYKKDAFFAYKANLSKDPFVHIAGKRYKDRAEQSTEITVYSNLPEVELVVNGRSLGKKRGEFGFFKFTVPMSERTLVEARAGACFDSAVFYMVEKFNQDYILKEKGAVLNWFDVTVVEGYFSLNDEIGEIMKTAEGKRWFDAFVSSFAKTE